MELETADTPKTHPGRTNQSWTVSPGLHTEHHAGHEQRIVPITPNLAELLQDRFDECEDGEERLVTIRGQGRISKQVRAIWARAGVDPWARLWQTLRSSCEKEWAMTLPQYAVSKWIGHSITVSGRHYANDVPDELFQRATMPHECHAQRNAQQNLHETGGNQQKTHRADETAFAPNSMPCNDLREFAAQTSSPENWRRGESKLHTRVAKQP